MRVKICGITRVEDALAAEAAGADAIGLNFVQTSKRYVTVHRAAEISAALGPFIVRVGVFVDAPLAQVQEIAEALKLTAVQLHGQEGADYAAALRERFTVIRAWSFAPSLELDALERFPADAILLDGLNPGSGERFAWEGAAFLRAFPKLILAGGLTPDNVAAGIAALRPYAVDVSSGVEAAPGIKDADKMQRFLRAARGVARERGPMGAGART